MAGAVPFKEGNINDTYRGSVFIEGGPRTAIIKDLAQKELANEIMSAAVGSLLDLPIPILILAWASADKLSARKGPILEDGRLVYASVDVGQPQVAMIYRSGGGKKVLERLAAWRKLGQLYGFDALVANIDRHAGNILFSGENEVWLIDHGHCFTGPNWTSGDLIPADKMSISRLNEWLTPELDIRQRNEIASEAVKIELGVAKLDLANVAVANHIDQLLSGGDLNAVLSFLDGRYRHVPRLAAQTLGIDKMV